MKYKPSVLRKLGYKLLYKLNRRLYHMAYRVIDMKMYAIRMSDRMDAATIGRLRDTGMTLTEEEIELLKRDTVLYINSCSDFPLDGRTFTCNKCLACEYCEFAYDPYNIDGDCLADK